MLSSRSSLPPVYVVTAANAGFNLPLTVMVTSLVANFNPARELKIYVLSLDSGEKERENVRQSVANVRPGLSRVEMQWPVLDPAWFAGLPESERFSRDAFSRIFAPDILPPECEKFVYLDSDMIVLADVGELNDSAIAPTTLHACLDIFSYRADCRDGVFNWIEMGLPGDAPMFNSGMLVIDVKRWRAKGIRDKVIDYARKNRGRTGLVDQTALNAYFYQDWTMVDPRWNQFDIIYPKAWEKCGYSRKTYRRARDKPCIVHFTGQNKPWHLTVQRPRDTYFFRYLAKTVFGETLRPQGFRLESIIGPRLYVRFWIFAVDYVRAVKRWLKGWQKAPPELEAARMTIEDPSEDQIIGP
jgi:lipopolysaccharide biosynthesis glycosyltransferase